MDAGIVVKVEDYDGMCKCLFCGSSVRGRRSSWHVSHDLTGLVSEGEAAAEVAALTGVAVREDAVPAVGGTLVAANVVVGEVQGGRTGAGRGSSGNGKEPAVADAGLDSGGEGEAASTGAGEDGGKGKGRADDGSAEACRGRSGMDCSGGGRLAEGSGRLKWAWREGQQ